ncbi:MAG: hypothetical protein ACRESG_08285, partial [Gammaproteobacteria bacterium]
LVLCLLLSASCATHLQVFRVIPASPQYLLRSPNSHETPFQETLRRYNGFAPRRGWMDLRPKMELRIENAYYRPGAPHQGLHAFLGTEIARYRVRTNGTLHLLSVRPIKDRPQSQPSVQQLIAPSQRRYRYHRFYYEVFFGGSGHARGSVLLGANTQPELKRLAGELRTKPDSVCGKSAAHCTAFPEECTVSIAMEVFVNGAPRNLSWDSDLAGVVDHPMHIEVLRSYHGHLTPIKLNPHDARALQLPLLPGDRVKWK